jgi:hypothetical protein
MTRIFLENLTLFYANTKPLFSFMAAFGTDIRGADIL